MSNPRHAFSESGYDHIPRHVSAPRAKARAWGNGQIVGIAGRVVRVREVCGERYGHALVIEDLAGRGKVETLPLYSERDERVLERAFEAVENGHLVIAYGSFPVRSKKDPEYQGPAGHMDLIDLRRLTRPTSMVAPTPDELSEADLVVDRIVAHRGLGEGFLTEELRRLCGVEPSFLSERYRLAELGVLVQALSYAQVPQTVNSRLGLFAFSGPGTGKNLLGDCARMTAAISDRVQPATTTLAGLAGHVELGGDGFLARSGILARTTGGVCVLDDLHRLDRRHMGQLQGLLMPVLEEGRIRTAKAGRATYDSRCGVVLTSNRVSLRDGRAVLVVNAGGVQGRASDLVLPFDLFSRTDLVFNLGEGDDAVRGAMKMASAPSCDEYPEEEDENRPTEDTWPRHQVEARRLKLIVARIKERIPRVDFTPIEEGLEEAMLKLGVLAREYTAHLRGVDQDSFDGDALARRMALTLRKLVGGLSRLDGRSVAEPGDIARALKLLVPKLEVLRYLCGSDDKVRKLPDPETQLRLVFLASDARWQEMLRLLGGQWVRVEQIEAALGCTDKVARRELAKRKIEPVAGVYRIPTIEEWEAEERPAASLRDELVGPPPSDEAVLPEAEQEVAEHRFNDCLPEVPREVKRLVRLQQTGQLERSGITHMVLWLITAELFGQHRDRLGTIMTGLRRWGQPEGGELPERWLGAALSWMDVPDWSERALRVMAFFAETRWTSERVALRQAIERRRQQAPPVPERIEAGYQAILARFDYYNGGSDEEWAALARRMLEEVRAQQAAAAPPADPATPWWHGKTGA